MHILMIYVVGGLQIWSNVYGWVSLESLAGLLGAICLLGAIGRLIYMLSLSDLLCHFVDATVSQHGMSCRCALGYRYMYMYDVSVRVPVLEGGRGRNW